MDPYKENKRLKAQEKQSLRWYAIAAIVLTLIFALAMGFLWLQATLSKPPQPQTIIVTVSAPPTQVPSATPIPSPTPLPFTATTLSSNVKLQGQLVTVETTLTVVVEDDRREILNLFGTRMLYQGVGVVRAGIDMGSMSEGNFIIQHEPSGETAVTLTIPQSAVFVYQPALDVNASQPQNVDIGFFSNLDPNIQTDIQRIAVAEMASQAEEMNIRSQARINAEVVLRGWAESMGIQKFFIIWQ